MYRNKWEPVLDKYGVRAKFRSATDNLDVKSLDRPFEMKHITNLCEDYHIDSLV